MKSREKKVRFEEMLPHEMEEAVTRFPVVYCAFGSLEWHGQHLPLGTDTLKAYHILIKTAETFGGVVAPPTYWGFYGYEHPWSMNFFDKWRQPVVEELYEKLFLGLITVGFKVIIGVTGHDVALQKDAIQSALVRIQKSGKATGFAMMEGDLYDLTEDKMDHAGHWETSLMMYLRPELVDMEKINNEDLSNLDGRKKAGIFGRDPRIYASRELGEKIANRISERIGQKAQELLSSLKITW